MAPLFWKLGWGFFFNRHLKTSAQNGEIRSTRKALKFLPEALRGLEKCFETLFFQNRPIVHSKNKRKVKSPETSLAIKAPLILGFGARTFLIVTWKRVKKMMKSGPFCRFISTQRTGRLGTAPHRLFLIGRYSTMIPRWSSDHDSFWGDAYTVRKWTRNLRWVKNSEMRTNGKNSEQRMPHFKSTFTTKFIKRIQRTKMFSFHIYSRMFRDRLRHLFDTCFKTESRLISCVHSSYQYVMHADLNASIKILLIKYVKRNNVAQLRRKQY